MSIKDIDVAATLKRVEKQLAEDTTMSEASHSLFEMLIVIITLMANSIGRWERTPCTGTMKEISDILIQNFKCFLKIFNDC